MNVLSSARTSGLSNLLFDISNTRNSTKVRRRGPRVTKERQKLEKEQEGVERDAYLNQLQCQQVLISLGRMHP
jgi:hypothetical protein